MKKLLLFLIFLTSVNLNAQTKKEISLDNSLTGILSQTKEGNEVNISFTGNNSFGYGSHITLESVTNYQVGYSPSLSQNELIQKSNLVYSKKNCDLFTTYQYNYSLLRQINTDNCIGLGGGFKEKFKSCKISISYAMIYQNTNYFYLENKEFFRHSIRGKVKIEKEIFTISVEYYYQPSIKDFKDYIVYGTTKLTLFPDKPFNFTAQEVVNYRSFGDFNMIQNITFGIGYQFSKKLEK